MPIPQLLLRRLYTLGSLENDPGGFHFEIKNRLTDVTLVGLRRLRVDGEDVPLRDIELQLLDGRVVRACDVTAERPAPFHLRDAARVRVRQGTLALGSHDVRLLVDTLPYGGLEVCVRDTVLELPPGSAIGCTVAPADVPHVPGTGSAIEWACDPVEADRGLAWDADGTTWTPDARWGGSPAANETLPGDGAIVAAAASITVAAAAAPVAVASAHGAPTSAPGAASSAPVAARGAPPTTTIAPDDESTVTGTPPVAAEPSAVPCRIPYDPDPATSNSPDLIAARRRFARDLTGATLEHVGHYSVDPIELAGNTENFIGVAQVPIGIAGPLHVRGEHANGNFLIPLATTEGTLVASYNRGIKVLNLSGGARCTVLDDGMQRAPVFVFGDARESRAFRDWITAHLAEIRREAESTSRHARLVQVETYLASKIAYLRFDFSTGDAAGQNMVSRATLAACEWILANAPGVRRFFLESNLATDKKTSQVNTLHTRGKRVTAEATVPAQVLRDVLRVEAETLHFHAGVANVGAMLAGTNNNGLHSANAITAMFIATGQDVANVAEGSAALVYGEVTRAGDLYISITLPSLIVATHGGGTGLPTQRECLAMLGCTGRGTVNKLAEIVAGVVLAGELSLAGAISSLEWVSAHEQYGRNR